MVDHSCPFCALDPELLFHVDDLVVGLWDPYPVSPGHALLVPKRHVASWFEATEEERVALIGAAATARQQIKLRGHHPDGYNLGINDGAAAGQTVFHLHLHVIPRYQGDVPDPRGGVRWALLESARYWDEPERVTPSDPREPFAGQTLAPHFGPLVAGGDDHLLPHLLAHIDDATRVDIAVAFVLQSGVAAIWDRLAELLDRAGRLRFLTGDYLGVTDPDALLQLLDLRTAIGEGASHRIELRIFEAGAVAFHPKVYLLHSSKEDGIAFVGSSNLTRSALATGAVEWNYRVVSSREPAGFGTVCKAFDRLFEHESTKVLDEEWIEQYRARRLERQPPPVLRSYPPPESPSVSDIHELDAVPSADVPETVPHGVELDEPDVPTPHEVQREALEALRRTRKEGNAAGLVVLATGLGKTWLAAFDSVHGGFGRVLFVAHREEILRQAMRTFRRIRPSAHLGNFVGGEKQPDAEILFASVQALSRVANLRQFDPDQFDYIVIDEFHHASARTYRKVIDHFEPSFLLGLTATPERTDGGDLLALCGENLVYRCDLAAGIERSLLAPFHYWGVPDEIDYSQIPWRSSRFDPEALDAAAATESRAENALDQWKRRGGNRTLGFCVSIRHADYMAEYFQSQGVNAVAVHSGADSAPRTASLERLAAAELDVVFAVDIFNEGVDIPEIDTVLMLRPTESRVLWLQQLGRGLRRAEGKSALEVVDYIGNHRSFLLKPQTLLGLGSSDREVAVALGRLETGELELPPGCEVTYELEAKEILRNLLRSPKAEEEIRHFVETFTELHGQRPTAVELFHEGYDPRAVRKASGSWPRFLDTLGLLSPEESQAYGAQKALLDQLGSTQMTKSYKMLLLLALLRRDALPGSIEIEELASSFSVLARRNPKLRDDVGPPIDQEKDLQAHLIKNPIAAWVGGRGTGGLSFFRYEDGRFSTTFSVEPELREAFQDLVRELADWRLAEYLTRAPFQQTREGGFVCKVSHNDQGPILFLPDRATHPELPSGWTTLEAQGVSYEARFVKIAVNVMREPGSKENVLGRVLRGWFGENAGSSGTSHRVTIEPLEGRWIMRPLATEEHQEESPLDLWRTYNRQEIADAYGLEFSAPVWNQGFVPKGERLFLFVTLDKSGLDEAHRYQDRFLSATEFRWQSQNRTRRSSKHGELIQKHLEKGVSVQLLVRQQKRTSQGKAAKFVYCGEVEFVRWEGDRPITVWWRLKRQLPEALAKRFLTTALD